MFGKILRALDCKGTGAATGDVLGVWSAPYSTSASQWAYEIEQIVAEQTRPFSAISKYIHISSMMLCVTNSCYTDEDCVPKWLAADDDQLRLRSNVGEKAGFTKTRNPKKGK